jgi:hypothetical protein
MAVVFISFCEMMVVSGWLRHDEIIIMDNAAIHTGGDLVELECFFWEMVVVGQLLHILVIYLPMRTPKLKPMELIIHIFSYRELSATASIMILALSTES